MRPGPHQHLNWAFQTLCDPERCVPEEIGPAAKEIDRDIHIRVVLRDRTPPPHLVPCLVFEPLRGPVAHGLQPLFPHITPALPYDSRVGRPCVVELHNRAPPEIVSRQNTTVEMNVFQPAVVGSHDRRDGLERGWPFRGNLKRIIGTPGFTEHADIAVAPILRGDPCDHIDAILGFEIGVFVEHHSLAVPRTALIDAQRGIAGLGKAGMHAFVTDTGCVPAAVRNVLEDRGGWIGPGTLGQPESGGELGAIWHRNPDGFDDFGHAAVFCSGECRKYKRAKAMPNNTLPVTY